MTQTEASVTSKTARTNTAAEGDTEDDVNCQPDASVSEDLTSPADSVIMGLQ